MQCCSHAWLAGIGALLIAGVLATNGPAQTATEAADDTPLGSLSVWDDGFAEMSYYDAVRPIYGRPREYTRVHILVREWFEPDSGTKTDKITSPSAVPVFKLNICEEVPTENYNYRLMRTLFAQRYTLEPLKLAASSQEWCGTSYKHLRWTGPDPGYRSFSYFEGEADQSRPLPDGAVPFETILLHARQLAAGPDSVSLKLLPPMDSTHGVAPRTDDVTLASGERTERVRTPAGTFLTRVVAGTAGETKLRLWIETIAPHRLIRYEIGEQRGTLRAVERRAYWNRDWPSQAHPAGEAP